MTKNFTIIKQLNKIVAYGFEFNYRILPDSITNYRPHSEGCGKEIFLHLSVRSQGGGEGVPQVLPMVLSRGRGRGGSREGGGGTPLRSHRSVRTATHMYIAAYLSNCKTGDIP